jgi:hypothetical protein
MTGFIQRLLLAELMHTRTQHAYYAAGPLWYLSESASSAAASLVSVDHLRIWDQLHEQKRHRWMRMHNSSGSPDVEVKTAVTYAKHYRGLPAPGGFCMALPIV